MSTMTDTKPAVTHLTIDEIAEKIYNLRQLPVIHANQHRSASGASTCHWFDGEGELRDCGHSSAKDKEEQLLKGHTTFNRGVILNKVDRVAKRKRFEFAMEQRQLLSELGCSESFIDNLFKVVTISTAVEVVQLYKQLLQFADEELLMDLILGGRVCLAENISDDTSVAFATGLGYVPFGFERRRAILRHFYPELTLDCGSGHLSKLLQGLELCIEEYLGKVRDHSDCAAAHHEVNATINAEAIRERQLAWMGLNLDAPRQTSNRRRRHNNKK